MELGLYTFVELPLQGNKGENGQLRTAHLLEEIKLADEKGLDVFAIGEHHRPDYLSSAPTVLLGAAAAVTKNIKLSTAVTVLSSEDPVRVYQQFSTIDLISKGRAEIMAGRGSFIESFPLFGYDLNDYDSLFKEKLELLIKLNKEERVKWQGVHRPAIHNSAIYPRPYQKEMPIWIAAGGTPASAVRAATLGLPLALAIIGGSLDHFVPFIDLYKNTWAKMNHTHAMQIGINVHGFLSLSSQKAADDFYIPHAEVMNRIGRERGWGPSTRGQYEGMRSRHGALFVGSPQEIIDKIMYVYQIFGNTRLLMQMTVGPTPHHLVMDSIELFATQVAPIVKISIQ
jgi:probable LLM family oxidoreductase